MPDSRSDSPLTGLFSATFTPMHGDGSLDLDQIGPLVDHLERDGVSGLYILGSTGEGASLTTSERMIVAEAFVQAARGRLRTVVQVGHDSLGEARGLAAHARKIGADAISAMPPAYFGIDDVSTLVESLAGIAEGAPDLPFYYYHIPTMTGVDPDLREFVDRAHARLPTFAGLKFSDTRLYDLLPCVRYPDGGCDTVFGVDEMLLAAVALGVRGAVGSTYAFATPVYLRMLEAFDRGDMEQARLEQARATDMVRVILATCGRSGMKAMMPLVGVDCGPYRLPQATADPRDVERMATALDDIGFFTWGRQREQGRPAERLSVGG